MKNSKFVLGIMAVCLSVILISATVSSDDIIRACLVNFNISMYKSINDRLLYPIISYNDNTYIAIRDMAALLKKNVEWDDESKQITFTSLDNTESIIKNEQTALQMGKAVIEEYFSDRLNESSAYRVTYSEICDPYHNDLWEISVVFNMKKDYDEDYILANADAMVWIDAETGNLSIMKKNINGGFETIVDFAVR